jgi:hypothetical protein
MIQLGRRAFLLLAAALWPAACRRPAAPLSLDEFLALSTRLTGFSDLDKDAAAELFKGWHAKPDGASRLRKLDLATEAELLIEWYTGIQTLNGSPHQATHTGALQWLVLRIPAPGTCAGAFGAWATKPNWSG